MRAGLPAATGVKESASSDVAGSAIADADEEDDESAGAAAAVRTGDLDLVRRAGEAGLARRCCGDLGL